MITEKHEVDVYVCGLLDSEEEEIATQSVGIMYSADDKIFVLYDERFNGDTEETRNTIIIDGNQIRLKKQGQINVNMIFEEGLVNNTVYGTQAGMIPLTVKTTMLTKSVKDNGVDFEVRYSIEFENVEPVQNCLRFHARYKDGFIVT